MSALGVLRWKYVGCSSRMLWLFLLCAMSGAEAYPYQHKAPQFAVGQEWSIRSTPETTAKVVIGRIEVRQGRVIVNVAIVDIPPLAIDSPGTGVSEIDHAPFEESTLARSVGRLLATAVAPPPGFEVGYREWKAKRGGVFTVSVSQVIALAQKTLARGGATS